MGVVIALGKMLAQLTISNAWLLKSEKISLGNKCSKSQQYIKIAFKLVVFPN